MGMRRLIATIPPTPPPRSRRSPSSTDPSRARAPSFPESSSTLDAGGRSTTWSASTRWGRRWSNRPAWSPTTSTSRSRGCGRRAPAGASTSSAGIYPIPPGARESVDLGSVRFPAVVKPATRHSSQGVCTVHDRAELAAQLHDYPAPETILVEQKITGQEYSVESLTQDGKSLFTSVTRKETTDVDSQYFVEMAHTVPAARDDAWDAVQRANNAMLDRLGVENGITHAEWRLDEQGEAHLIEVAARTPGDGIMVLYQLATGRAIEPEILRIALGET